MKGLYTVLLLVISNTFMTFAWYGHLKLKEYSWFSKLSLFAVILLSWGLALFEYVFMVPANKIGFRENGGPFSLLQLKIIQEAITLTIFVVFVMVLFKGESIRWNHIVAFALIILAVFFMFLDKK